MKPEELKDQIEGIKEGLKGGIKKYAEDIITQNNEPIENVVEHAQEPVFTHMDAIKDFLSWFFFGTIDIVTTQSMNVVNGVKMFVSYILSSIGMFFYGIVFKAMHWWFLNGFSWVPLFWGNEGITEKEICAKLIGTESSLFTHGTGKETCENKIFQEVTGRASFVTAILFTLFVCYGLGPCMEYLHYWWTYNDILLSRESEQKEKKKSYEKGLKTKEANECVKRAFGQIVGLLKIDNQDAASKIITMRQILDDIDNDKAKQMLGWRKRKWVLNGMTIQDIILDQITADVEKETDILEIEDGF